jgi:anti-anti-sigma factor
VVVAVAGEFDLALADPVRAVLTRAISERRQRLVVDLTRLTFIDSSGLHTIADAYRLCRDSGPAMTIRPGPPNVQLVFAMTKLLDHLPFEV